MQRLVCLKQGHKPGWGRMSWECVSEGSRQEAVGYKGREDGMVQIIWALAGRDQDLAFPLKETGSYWRFL